MKIKILKQRKYLQQQTRTSRNSQIAQKISSIFVDFQPSVKFRASHMYNTLHRFILHSSTELLFNSKAKRRALKAHIFISKIPFSHFIFFQFFRATNFYALKNQYPYQQYLKKLYLISSLKCFCHSPSQLFQGPRIRIPRF